MNLNQSYCRIFANHRGSSTHSSVKTPNPRGLSSIQIHEVYLDTTASMHVPFERFLTSLVEQIQKKDTE